MTQEPPETTAPDDDEELELGFCWGCWRLEVDEESSFEDELELVVEDELAPEEFEELDDDVE